MKLAQIQKKKDVDHCAGAPVDVIILTSALDTSGDPVGLHIDVKVRGTLFKMDS